MIIKGAKIYHALIALFFLLLLFRFDVLLHGIELIWYLIIGLVENPKIIINKIDLITFDYIISTLFFFIIPIVLYRYRKNIAIWNYKLDYSSLVFLVLFFLVVYAPIITNYNPNAQNSIKATRFLPPFSKVKIIDLSNNKEGENTFENIKRKYVNKETITDKLYIRLSETDENIIIKKNGKSIKITKDELKRRDDIKSKIFILGTDELGRDIFSRIIYGARVSLFIAFFTVSISLVIGVLLGFIAANYGGVFNIILSRLTDMFLSIPSIFFVIMVLAFWGNSILSVVLVLGFTGWMSIFKIVKGEITSIKEKDYFITSKKLGLSFWQLLFKEIFPMLIISLTVAIVFQFSNVILAESSLSYLGLGVGINYPSWGNMILSGQQYMQRAWWMFVIPSVSLIILLLSINSFGEKIKKILNPTITND